MNSADGSVKMDLTKGSFAPDCGHERTALSLDDETECIAPEPFEEPITLDLRSRRVPDRRTISFACLDCGVRVVVAGPDHVTDVVCAVLANLGRTRMP